MLQYVALCIVLHIVESKFTQNVIKYILREISLCVETNLNGKQHKDMQVRLTGWQNCA